MNAKPDCIVCLLNQYLKISRLCGLEEETIKTNFFGTLAELSELNEEMTPPEIAAYCTNSIEKTSGVSDPYKDIKILSNESAMELYPELKQRVSDAEYPFAEALALAIAGNLIDYGAKISLNLHDALEEILSQPLFQHIEEGEDFNQELFQLSRFHNELKSAENIIYLGDNAGEIVFDRIFIETLLKEFPDKKITFVVRGGPALNDALLEDTADVGIDKIVDVMSSGTATAGTVLSNCSEDFLDKLYAADLVISKGQGNYEALSGQELPPTWFLFRIKCDLVAEHAGGPEGALVLKKNRLVKEAVI
ncbi:MAG: ARMT1-like domain-containing protein [Spirochaetales bacterium]|uniref:ARMT1-like domain-containing protein n=1 Tax=Candidatus Thalassospirochaeta sargassi TaxID=3119039 RepID=A0AAJ1IB88_9SPIO|nr:ARMT1-like domain-containing protein [Spirochaetales bacterium]